MYKIFFKGSEYLTVNGVPKREAECSFNEDIYVLAGGAYPSLPTAAVLKVRKGKLLPCPGVTITYWGNACAEAYIREREYLPVRPAAARAFSNVMCGGTEHIATLFYCGVYYFTIETREETFTADIPLKEVASLELHAEVMEKGALLTLIFRGERQFVYSLIYDKDYFPVMKCVTDGATVNGTRILLTDILRDMCRLSVTREYSLSSGKPKLISRAFAYREDMIDYPPALLPYLYAESAMRRDEDMCRRISRADFYNTFSGCACIAAPPHMQLEKNQTALLRPCEGGYSAEVYAFKTGAMIEDISRVKI